MIATHFKSKETRLMLSKVAVEDVWHWKIFSLFFVSCKERLCLCYGCFLCELRQIWSKRALLPFDWRANATCQAETDLIFRIWAVIVLLELVRVVVWIYGFERAYMPKPLLHTWSSALACVCKRVAEYNFIVSYWFLRPWLMVNGIVKRRSCCAKFD